MYKGLDKNTRIAIMNIEFLMDSFALTFDCKFGYARNSLQLIFTAKADF